MFFVTRVKVILIIHYTFIDIKNHFYELITKFINRTFQVMMCLFRYHIDKRLFWEGHPLFSIGENVTYNGFTKGFMKYFCNTFYSLYRSMLSPSFPYFGCHFNIYIYLIVAKLLSGQQLIITMIVLMWIYIPLALLALYAYLVCQTRVQFQMHFKLSTEHKTLKFRLLQYS